jgi:Recombination, repair and ssDNA binding protein UvsY
VTLTELQEMWKADCNINITDLGTEAANSPRLHAKYLQLLTSTRLKLRKVEVEFLRLRRNKEQYFRGELTKEELESLGWDQYLYNKPLRAELDGLLLMDDDMIKAQDRVEYYKTLLYQLEQIIKSINGRTWDIKAAIDWQKFTQGGF